MSTAAEGKSLRDKVAAAVSAAFKVLEIKDARLRPFNPKQSALFAPFFMKKAEKSADGGGAAAAAANASQEDTTAPPVPCKPNRSFDCPSLLLYDLENATKCKETAAYKYIKERNPFGAGMLYGTSGAGKTRSVYEYLSHNYGFFFVTADHERNAGSVDLMYIFDDLASGSEYGGRRLSTIQEVSQTNLDLIKMRVLLLIFVRIMVYKHINEKMGRDISPYEWLMYQVFPQQFLGVDVFQSVVLQCMPAGREDSTITLEYMKSMDTELQGMLRQGWVNVVPFVDEAQVLLKQNQDEFRSATSDKKRSAFSALLKAFNKIARGVPLLGYPIFSGTGMSLDDFEEQSASASIKDHEIAPRGAYFAFQSSQSLSADVVQSYLRTFLTLDTIRREVVEHVAKWLKGRPRFAASFVETYLLRSGKDSRDYYKTRGRFNALESILMQGLDRYIHAQTTDPDRPRYSGIGPTGDNSSKATTAYACFKRCAYADEQQQGEVRRGIPRMKRVLRCHLIQFAVGGKPGYIREGTKKLIDGGVVALDIDQHKNIVGVLDEPIMVEAGMNVYMAEGEEELGQGFEDVLSESVSSSLGDGLGQAYEELLLSPLRNNKRWQEFLTLQLGPDHAFTNYSVSSKSAYGVVARNCKEGIAATLDWIKQAVEAKFEGQVPPFCLPDNHCGPDIMHLMWDNDYFKFCTCLTQAKFSVEVNNLKALRTIVPAWLYHNKKGVDGMTWSANLTKDQALFNNWITLWAFLFSGKNSDGDKQPCLRFLAEYPANATASAVPGKIHNDDDGICAKGKGCDKKEHDYLVVASGLNQKDIFRSNTVAALDFEKGQPRQKKLKTDAT